MEKTLSIIVPVYNVKPYLKKCLRTLLNQDFTSSDYEIILVDDGSTDGGSDLCDEFAKQNAIFKVIHQTNQGLSAARNSGLKIACGQYILFVDSDDWLEYNVLGHLVNRMEQEDLDVLRFRFRRVDESEYLSSSDTPGPNSTKYPVWTGEQFLTQKLWYSCYAWQFVIKRKLLSDNGLFFKPGIIFEDTEWTPRMLKVAQRVSDIDLLVYNYYVRSGSITNSTAKRRIEGQLSLIDDLKAQMPAWKDKRWHKGMITHLVVTIVSMLGTSLFSERNLYLQKLKEKNVYPLSEYQATESGKRKIHLINISPQLTCLLIHLANL